MNIKVLSKYLSPIFFILIFSQFIGFSCLALELNSCLNIFKPIGDDKVLVVPALNISRVIKTHVIEEFDKVFYFGTADDGLIMGFSLVSKHILIFQNLNGVITPHSDIIMPQFPNLGNGHEPISKRSFFSRLFGQKPSYDLQVRNIFYSNGYLQPELVVDFTSSAERYGNKIFRATYGLIEKKWSAFSEIEVSIKSSELILLQTFSVNDRRRYQNDFSAWLSQLGMSSAEEKVQISIFKNKKTKHIVAIRNDEPILTPNSNEKNLVMKNTVEQVPFYSAVPAYSGNVDMIFNQQQLVGVDKENQKIIFFESLFF